MRARTLVPTLLLLAAFPGAAVAADEVGPQSGLTGNGRRLDPAGRLTPTGTFPLAGAITPDGRTYWAVDGGRRTAFVRLIDIASGRELQKLPIPGGTLGIAFAPDSSRAYVSGLPAEDDDQKDLKGAGGDVVHVFAIGADRRASEVDPIALPDGRDGQAAADNLPPSSGVKSWPQGLAVSADGATLVVVLGQADQVAIIDLATRRTRLADVGRYPYAVALDPRRPRAYVTSERDGSVGVVDLRTGKLVDAIAVGGERGAAYAHPQGLAVDAARDRLYVAVTDRDLLAVVDLAAGKVIRYVDVGRREGIGVAPIDVAVAPDGRTAYVANAGEDAVAAVALEDRPAQRVRVVRPRSLEQIGRYRIAGRRASRARERRLRRRLLRGRATRACSGPTARQDRRVSDAILRAYRARDRAVARGRSRVAAQRTFRTAVRRARRGLPAVVDCRPGTKAFTVLGRIPTAAYTTDVDVSPDGRTLVWLAARGLGTGSNAPDVNIDRLLQGRAGVLPTPSDVALGPLTARADRAVVPVDRQDPPAGTPVRAGGPIKYVFYVVKENRTYDQVLGDDRRGRGDPSLTLFGQAVTPNVHALARTFPLLDRVFANSEESTVGHKVTAGSYANDYTQRKVAGGRGRKGDPDIFAIGVTPNAFVFDQAVRQGVSFRAYGELGAGNQPFADDGRDTFDQVAANTDYTYPSQVQGTCRSPVTMGAPLPNSARCTADSTDLGDTRGPPSAQSRMRVFQSEFAAQVAAGTVPSFNYMILFNDHTDGTTPGTYTPRANVADNDLAVGQLVQLVSRSSIWAESAIFVLEDDSQDGVDSVDAHRIPALVVSPYARRGVVVSKRYDQLSFLRTAEIITGLKPLSLNDALATPLYDAFISGGEQPDVEGTRFTAIQPQQSMTEVNGNDAPMAALSRALPWGVTDAVPQRLADQILWRSVHGAASTVPPAGPNNSVEERVRALGALDRFRSGGDVRAYLSAGADEDG